MKHKFVDRTPAEEVAGIVIPWFVPSDRPSDARIEETSGLAEALGCTLKFVDPEHVRKTSPGYLLSSGMLDRLKVSLESVGATLLIVDGNLTPVQQRNIERALGVKVIDRTGLILEIFGLRAQTKAGRLQVELARQLYERSRLVRTWTHLERQRGGRGFLSGPGESQLEADKRMLDTRVRRLREELEAVRRTRLLQRKGRTRSGTLVIAFVGYTNAGKSTLFNRLSGADVLAKDMPFATLDPTIRRIRLPELGEVALVDTVGFISDLPTHLIESFQATLEEAMEADLLVHVRDRSSLVDAKQKRDVETVLDALREQVGHDLPPLIEVWNKADALADEHRELLAHQAGTAISPEAALVSALTGVGVPELVTLIERTLRKASVEVGIRLPPEDGAVRSWLYSNGEVLNEAVSNETGASDLSVRLTVDRLGQFRTLFPHVSLAAEEGKPTQPI